MVALLPCHICYQFLHNSLLFLFPLLKSLIYFNSVRDIWIGLYRNNTDSRDQVNWKWLDGTTYRKIGSMWSHVDEPGNGEIVARLKKGDSHTGWKYAGIKNDNQYSYVCERGNGYFNCILYRLKENNGNNIFEETSLLFSHILWWKGYMVYKYI